MPDSSLKYDPTTPEGRDISDLFRAIKSIEDADGSWSGADAVAVIERFFGRLGINIEGSVYQVDPIPPQAVSPKAHPDTVAELLTMHLDFTTNGYPSGTEGFFYAETGYDRTDDYTRLTFPHACDTRLRTALTVLRATGYAATLQQEPATPDSTARTICVDAGALYPLPEDAPVTDRAMRLLYDAGFIHHADNNNGRAPVIGHTTPTPVDWRSDWVQLSVTAPRTTGRFAREDAGRAMAATLTAAGWTVDARGTETLHTTPPPSESRPKTAREPELVPADVIDSIHKVLGYNWTSEQLAYDKQDPEDQQHHIANDLNRIAKHWDLHRI